MKRIHLTTKQVLFILFGTLIVSSCFDDRFKLDNIYIGDIVLFGDSLVAPIVSTKAISIFDMLGTNDKNELEVDADGMYRIRVSGSESNLATFSGSISTITTSFNFSEFASQKLPFDASEGLVEYELNFIYSDFRITLHCPNLNEELSEGNVSFIPIKDGVRLTEEKVEHAVVLTPNTEIVLEPADIDKLLKATPDSIEVIYSFNANIPAENFKDVRIEYKLDAPLIFKNFLLNYTRTVGVGAILGEDIPLVDMLNELQLICTVHSSMPFRLNINIFPQDENGVKVQKVATKPLSISPSLTAQDVNTDRLEISVTGDNIVQIKQLEISIEVKEAEQPVPVGKDCLTKMEFVAKVLGGVRFNMSD